ncbi:glycosyltransferase [Roseibacillus ishigakijimensis]|uniref:glycosyltransferase n=1 Tax=Roseibacillus ishigakijimensis TaxID=454146 RepID=UPI001902E009|nr:glycosyltransferase [Roseibacillus ishigakijimensis]
MKLLEEAGIAADIYWGTTPEEAMVEIGVDAVRFRERWGRALVPGEVGCYCSHLGLLREFLAKREAGWLAVFEDDAVPDGDLGEFLGSYAREAEALQVDYLNLKPGHEELEGEHWVVPSTGHLVGTYGYMVNQVGAALICGALPMTGPLDEIIWRLPLLRRGVLTGDCPRVGHQDLAGADSIRKGRGEIPNLLVKTGTKGMGETANILIATDDAGLEPHATVIASLVRRCTLPVHVRCYYRGHARPEDFERKGLKVEFLEPVKSPAGRFPAHVSQPAMDRFLGIRDCCDWDRALVLDWDQLVLTDVRPLFELDFGGHLLAARLWHKNLADAAWDWFRRRLPPEFEEAGQGEFFYLGPLLNLEAMREEGFWERFLAVQEAVGYEEQIALALAGQGRVLGLAAKWNLVPGWDRPGENPDGILHYTMPSKPWSHPGVEMAEYWHREQVSWEELKEGGERVSENAKRGRGVEKGKFLSEKGKRYHVLISGGLASQLYGYGHVLRLQAGGHEVTYSDDPQYPYWTLEGTRPPDKSHEIWRLDALGIARSREEPPPGAVVVPSCGAGSFPRTFDGCGEALMEAIQFDDPSAEEMIRQVKEAEGGLMIRRGDFLRHGYVKEGIPDYACEPLQRKSRLVVCSDDYPWVEQNLQGCQPLREPPGVHPFSVALAMSHAQELFGHPKSGFFQVALLLKQYRESSDCLARFGKISGLA